MNHGRHGGRLLQHRLAFLANGIGQAISVSFRRQRAIGQADGRTLKLFELKLEHSVNLVGAEVLLVAKLVEHASVDDARHDGVPLDAQFRKGGVQPPQIGQLLPFSVRRLSELDKGNPQLGGVVKLEADELEVRAADEHSNGRQPVEEIHVVHVLAGFLVLVLGRLVRLLEEVDHLAEEVVEIFEGFDGPQRVKEQRVQGAAGQTVEGLHHGQKVVHGGRGGPVGGRRGAIACGGGVVVEAGGDEGEDGDEGVIGDLAAHVDTEQDELAEFGGRDVAAHCGGTAGYEPQFKDYIMAVFGLLDTTRNESWLSKMRSRASCRSEPGALGKEANWDCTG